jgi:hypothetical protein
MTRRKVIDWRPYNKNAMAQMTVTVSLSIPWRGTYGDTTHSQWAIVVLYIRCAHGHTFVEAAKATQRARRESWYVYCTEWLQKSTDTIGQRTRFSKQLGRIPNIFMIDTLMSTQICARRSKVAERGTQHKHAQIHDRTCCTYNTCTERYHTHCTVLYCTVQSSEREGKHVHMQVSAKTKEKLQLSQLASQR